jgi:hypothetical protein
MHIDRVTITGADDSVKAAELWDLSKEFPFVEWGILVSKNSMGSPRFPTFDWLLDFRSMTRTAGHMDASMHICGRWVREILKGEPPQELWPILDCFQRVQLNFHAEDMKCIPAAFRHTLRRYNREGPREFIFQIDGNRGINYLIEATADGDLHCFPLFDQSGGRGALPGQWPLEISIYAYHGYAGGLGPDNLAEQIQAIGKVVTGNFPIWIDMETNVRSDSDRLFDLSKVRRCLEIAKPFIIETARNVLGPKG